MSDDTDLARLLAETRKLDAEANKLLAEERIKPSAAAVDRTLANHPSCACRRSRFVRRHSTSLWTVTMTSDEYLAELERLNAEADRMLAEAKRHLRIQRLILIVVGVLLSLEAAAILLFTFG